jgi:hypothetical protein
VAYPLNRPRVWQQQPTAPVRVKPEYAPIAGICPGPFGRAPYLVDTCGAPLTNNPTLTELEPFGRGGYGGMAVKFTDTPNTGMYRDLRVIDHPLSVLIVASCATVAGNVCITSIANTSDKLCRVFCTNSGTIFAQHIGATSNASATTGQAWTFGNWFVTLCSFTSPTSILNWCRGNFAWALPGSSGTTVGALGTLTRVSFGIYDGSARVTQFANGRVALIQWMRRSFVAQDAATLLINPWQIFEDEDRIAFQAAAAGVVLPVFVHQHKQQGIM